MLFFHQVFNDLVEVIDLGDIGIGGFFRGEDRPPPVKQGDDMGILDATVLGLDVVDLTLITEIVIEPDNHANP